MKILAVIVTYNRLLLLKECVKALKAQTYKEFDILIINNNSTDDTEKYCLSIASDRIFYYNTGANIGGAGGFAMGIRYALAYNYDWCWVMDDDTIASEDALFSLVNKVNLCKNELSFVASVVRWVDGSTCVMNRQAVATDWLGRDENIDKYMIKCTFSSFVSTMINLKFARQIGLPIAEMFIYGDDLEYTMRLTKCAPGYIDLDSMVIHKMGANTSTDLINTPSDRIDRFYYNYRNRLYIDRKHNKAKNNLFNCAKQFVKILISQAPNKSKRLKILCKGVIDGLSFNPPIVKDYTWNQ